MTYVHFSHLSIIIAQFFGLLYHSDWRYFVPLYNLFCSLIPPIRNNRNCYFNLIISAFALSTTDCPNEAR